MDEWQPNQLVTTWRSKQCTWCGGLIQDESFIVTFPDKAQALFHIECLYHYREMMGPAAS